MNILSQSLYNLKKNFYQEENQKTENTTVFSHYFEISSEQFILVEASREFHTIDSIQTLKDFSTLQNKTHSILYMVYLSVILNSYTKEYKKLAQTRFNFVFPLKINTKTYLVNQTISYKTNKTDDLLGLTMDSIIVKEYKDEPFEFTAESILFDSVVLTQFYKSFVMDVAIRHTFSDLESIIIQESLEHHSEDIIAKKLDTSEYFIKKTRLEILCKIENKYKKNFNSFNEGILFYLEYYKTLDI